MTHCWDLQSGLFSGINSGHDQGTQHKPNKKKKSFCMPLSRMFRCCFNSGYKRTSMIVHLPWVSVWQLVPCSLYVCVALHRTEMTSFCFLMTKIHFCGQWERHSVMSCLLVLLLLLLLFGSPFFKLVQGNDAIRSAEKQRERERCFL